MNNKFASQGQYRDDRFRGGNDYGRDRGLRSPDLEFETSGPYRQLREPYGETWSGRDAGGHDVGGQNGSYGRASSGEYRGGYAGRGPKGYVRNDERIREDVCDRLNWNDEIDATEITVSVANGEVTLEGSVESRHMKRLAEDVAEVIPGVTDVHNRLRVNKSVFAEVKEKLTGEEDHHHHANTGTKTRGPTSPEAHRLE
jgi:BON domain